MALSKKHFEAFAARFKQQLAQVDEDVAKFHLSTETSNLLKAHLLSLAIKHCHDFTYENARFDRERFLKAAGF